MARKKNVKSPSKDNPLGGYVELGRDHLNACMEMLKTVLVRRAIRKDAATVHIDVKPNGSATIAATDTENSLQLKLNVLSVTGSGRVMIESHALDAMLGAYHEPRVRIHLDDPKEIRVEGLKTKLKLPGADPAKEWKNTAPGSLTANGFIVRADALVSAIMRTKFATDQDGSTRYTLGGLALHFPEGEAGYLEIVGTDGRRLSVVRLPVRAFGVKPDRFTKPRKEGSLPNKGVPVLPNKSIKTLVKIAREAGESSLGLAVIPGDPIDLEKEKFKPGQIQAVTRTAVLTAQCPEGRYPNWREVYPAEEIVAEFRLDDATPLREILATAVAACDSEHKGIDLTMAGGCVMIESGSETKGKTQVYLTEVPMTGKGTVALDGLMFRQFFDVIGNERLQVKFHGPKAPIVCHAGPDHEFVIMLSGTL
jgi:DNA polymerase-3 subunit beta